MKKQQQMSKVRELAEILIFLEDLPQALHFQIPSCISNL